MVDNEVDLTGNVHGRIENEQKEFSLELKVID